SWTSWVRIPSPALTYDKSAFQLHSQLHTPARRCNWVSPFLRISVRVPWCQPRPETGCHQPAAHRPLPGHRAAAGSASPPLGRGVWRDLRQFVDVVENLLWVTVADDRFFGPQVVEQRLRSDALGGPLVPRVGQLAYHLHLQLR